MQTQPYMIEDKNLMLQSHEGNAIEHAIHSSVHGSSCFARLKGG